jgi:hypothetical protein
VVQAAIWPRQPQQSCKVSGGRAGQGRAGQGRAVVLCGQQISCSRTTFALFLRAARESPPWASTCGQHNLLDTRSSKPFNSRPYVPTCHASHASTTNPFVHPVIPDDSSGNPTIRSRNWKLPVTGFGPWGRTNGCAFTCETTCQQTGPWPAGMCSLKKVADPNKPPYWSNDASEYMDLATCHMPYMCQTMWYNVLPQGHMYCRTPYIMPCATSYATCIALYATCTAMCHMYCLKCHLYCRMPRTLPHVVPHVLPCATGYAV